MEKGTELSYFGIILWLGIKFIQESHTRLIFLFLLLLSLQLEKQVDEILLW